MKIQKSYSTLPLLMIMAVLLIQTGSSIGDPAAKPETTVELSTITPDITPATTEAATTTSKITYGTTESSTTPETTLATTELTTTTPETTTTTTKRALTEEDLSSLAVLDDTDAAIQATKLVLYKQKTQLSLNFLTELIPVLQAIHDNLTKLHDVPLDVPFANYKQADDVLEDELTQVENKMGSNRLQIQKYSLAFQHAEEKLRAVHKTLGTILLPHLTAETDAAEIEEESDLTGTTPISLSMPTGPNVLRACGGTVRSDSGSIVYKYDENLNEYEGCVWAISSLNRMNLLLSIRSIQFQPNRQNFVSVGYFNDTEYHSSFIWQNFEYSTTPDAIEVLSPVALVSFVASPSGGTSRRNKGFYLDFTTAYTLNPSYEKIYTNMFLSGPNGTFKYPTFGGEYRNHERVAIVVQPTLPDTTLNVKWWDFEAECCDHLSIFTFGSNYTWSLRERLMSRRPTSSLKTYVNDFGERKNPFILIFRSDRSASFTGFEFTWNN